MNEVSILKAVHCAFFVFSCKCIKDERCVCTTANVSGSSPEKRNETSSSQLTTTEAFGLGTVSKKNSSVRLMQKSPVSFCVVIKNCGCVAFYLFNFFFFATGKGFNATK